MTQTRRSGRPFHWAWVILITCFADIFVNYSARLGYGVVLPDMIGELRLTRTDAGSIFNAYLFTYVLVTPLAGYLTDRLGARVVISSCSLALGAGLLLMGRTDSLFSVCLAYGIVGLGATGMWTPVITVVQRWFSPRRRGFALGILSTGYGLGFAVMGLIFPWIARGFGWRYAWYALGAAALFMVFLNGLLLRRDPESSGCSPWGWGSGSSKPAAETGPCAPAGEISFGAFFRDPRFWTIGVSYFFASLSLYGITTFMVDFARHEAGFSLEKASFLATIHGTAQIAGVLVFLPLSDVVGRKKTIILSNVLIASAIAGIVLYGGAWGALCFFVALLALFYGVTFPIYGACAGDHFRKEVMGTVIGAWTPFYGLGAMAAHWMGGLLRDTTGSYYDAFVLNACAAAVAAGVMIFVGDASKK